jgi:hypothetical protein
MDLEPSEPVIIESLRLEFLGRTSIRLTGSLRTQSAQDELNRRLETLHHRITNAKLESFTVDVRGLNFVNSSAIRVFINWISRAETAAYKLVFLTDRDTTWHRLSFSVLQSLAPNSVQIIEGGAPSGSGGSQ